VYCPKCGSQIPDDSLFCTRCGAQIASQVTSQKVTQQLPTTPASQMGMFLILMTGNVEERRIAFTTNYGRGFRLAIQLLDSAANGTTSEGTLTIFLTNQNGPLKLRIKEPKDILRIQSPKPGRGDGVSIRWPYRDFARYTGNIWTGGVVPNDCYYGHSPINVNGSDFRKSKFTIYTTGAEHEEVRLEHTSLGTVFIPAQHPILHVWFLTSDKKLLYNWRKVDWLDRSGMWT